MAITDPSVFLRFVLSTFLLLCCSAYAVGGEETTVDHHHESHVVKIGSLIPSTLICSTSDKVASGLNRRSSLKIVHRHGPCSQSQLDRGTEKTKTHDQLLKQILLQDGLRVASLERIFSKESITEQSKNSKATLPSRSGISLGTLNFVVRVGFGTPKKDFSLVFDTGSDLTWIQCKPCVGYCHPQEDPTFDPSNSASYSNVSCKTAECSQLASATSMAPACFASTTTCVYGIQYGDSSFSAGFFGRETLTLTPSDVFPNFLFGCGQNNRGLFGKVAGLLGLGRNKLSLVSQTSKKYRGIFSYCLPSDSNSTGYLSLGVGRVSSSVKFTPLLTNSKGPSFYFLDLLYISVGGRKLGISPTVFASSGTLIDSGTVITRLPPTVYAALRSSFRKLMSKYPLGEAYSLFDTCYDLTGYDTVSIPKIALFFRGGAKVDVDASGILVIASASQVCLAFAGNVVDEDLTILGNRQQLNLDVIYDVAKGRIGFGPGSCG